MELNTDPSLRYVVMMSPLDTKKSVSGGVGCGYLTWEQIKQDFSDSQPIREFFHSPSTLNGCLYIVLYKDQSGNMRRRIGRASVQPKNQDEIFDMLEAMSESLGIKSSFHREHCEIKTSFHTMLRPVATKEQIKIKHTCCLYELLYANNLDLDRPFENLASVKEKYLRQATLRNDRALALVGGFLQHYIENRNTSYRLVDKFAQQLHKTEIKLPQSFIKITLSPILIEFPFAFKFKSFQLKHAYLSIVSDLKGGFALTLASAQYDKEGAWDGASFLSSSITISENKEDIETSLEQTTSYLVDLEGDDLLTFKSFVRLCLKSLIYLYSAEPNLSREAGATSDKSSAHKLKKFYRHNNPFDVVSVGYGFHGINYSVDSTLVQGFFRWQRFGPGLALVKLIWIDEHERHYNKSDE